MKTAHAATIASLMLFVGAPAFAQDAKNDKTGMSDLGVNISTAGTTAEENKAFIETLTPEEQTKVKEVCLEVVGAETEHTPEVLAFCRNVNPPT